jgi:phosphatidate cytidylyltransferase
VPVVVVLFIVGPPWLTLALALLAALAAYEAAQLVKRAGLPANLWLPVSFAPLAVLGLAALLGPTGLQTGWILIVPAIGVLVIVAALVGFAQRDPADGFRSWLGTLFACLYPSLLAFAAVFVGLMPGPQDGELLGFHLETGRLFLLVLLLTVWTLDSGAYVAGKYHHRGHFMNHISPNKTWSGAIGGAVAAIIVCTVLMWAIGQSAIGGALLGLVIAVAAQAGDLAESMLKRAAGAKDSGTLIPGHGGFLDRVDSFLFAAPAMYASLAVVGVLHVWGWL